MKNSLFYRIAFFLALAPFFLVKAPAFGQISGSIRGQVVNNENTPLPGVTVLALKKGGEQTGRITDDGGHYSIAASKGDTLVISAVGFQTQRIIIEDFTEKDIKLLGQNEGLDELVVIGYGSQRKKDVTAAISTINTSRLEDFSNTNPTQLLQGQAPGVQVQESTGAPGSEFSVIIRGLGSIGASSAPLYVVDGFPIGTTIDQSINPADIASISILKDAVSTAIYGARGANGVVLITTKQAEEGKTSLSVNAKFGISNVPQGRRYKMLNGPEFAEFRKERFIDNIRYFENREPDVSEIPEDFRFPEQTKYSTNWFNEILNDNAPFQNYELSFSNGSNKMHSLISANYTNQEGAIIKTDFKSYSLRADVGGEFNNFISYGLNLTGSYSNEKNMGGETGTGSVLENALLADPREPIYNEDGSFNNYLGGHDGVFGFPNPVQRLYEEQHDKRNGNFRASAFLEFSFLRHFRFKSVANTWLRYIETKNYVPSVISGVNAPAPRDASESDASSFGKNISADQLLSYENIFRKHHIDGLLGFSTQEDRVTSLSGSGTEFPDDLTPYLGSAAHIDVGSGRASWSMLAYFVRVNYSFNGKYLFSGTYRREGSSRFGSKNRYANFPGISLGWLVSEENFLKDVEWLANLKIRGSWGETGNNNIGNYSSLSFLNQSDYILGGNFAAGNVIGSLSNNLLSWEKSRQIDLGLDLGVLENTLNFTLDVYRKITTSMLFSSPVPSVSGFTSFLDNIGKVRNQGIELGIQYNKSFGEFKFWGNLTFSANRNKVLALRNPDDEIVAGSLYDTYNVTRVGRPIGMIHGFRTLGIFQNQEEIDNSPTQAGAIPGSFKFWDANGDGVVEYDRTDMVEIGNPWPEFIWGVTLGGAYKNFDISMLLTGAQKYDLFSRLESSTMNMDGVFNVLTKAKTRWRSEQNPGKNYWPTTNFWQWERESNSRYVHGGSHLWGKDLTIGYTLPKKESFPFGARIYLSAHNLFLISHYPGNNPEVNSRGGINPGYDDMTYPSPRIFTLGINLNF